MKKLEIKTKRMTLRPMSDDEIEALMEHIDSEELCTAYEEMLDGCKRDPENRIWYAPWEMVLTSSQESVGDLGFKGPVRMSRSWRPKLPRTIRLHSVYLKSVVLCQLGQMGRKGRALCWNVRLPIGVLFI